MRQFLMVLMFMFLGIWLFALPAADGFKTGWDNYKAAKQAIVDCGNDTKCAIQSFKAEAKAASELIDYDGNPYANATEYSEWAVNNSGYYLIMQYQGSHDKTLLKTAKKIYENFVFTIAKVKVKADSNLAYCIEQLK